MIEKPQFTYVHKQITICVSCLYSTGDLATTNYKKYK